MSIAEGSEIAGEPSGSNRDWRGTVWSEWPNELGRAEIGCVESCSGPLCSTSWRMQAQLQDEQPASVFHPAIVAVTEAAIRHKPTVQHRAIHVADHEYGERATLILETKWTRGLSWATDADAGSCEADRSG